MIRLRGHHLVCLHFFSGEGFAPEFIGNLREIIQRAEAGEEVSACTGPDDICNRCAFLKADRCRYTTDADDEISEMDLAAYELLNAKAGQKTTWTDLKAKIPGMFAQWSKHCCSVCDWKQVCAKNREFSRLMQVKSP